MNSLREALIAEAEALARDGMPLPLDLISSLMTQGIDHTLFQTQEEPDDIEYSDFDEDGDPHNVD